MMSHILVTYNSRSWIICLAFRGASYQGVPHPCEQVVRERRQLLQAHKHHIPDAPCLPGPAQLVVHLFVIWG